MDQLLPISETLVNNVEETLRGIVQDAINESLSTFPTLKQAVEAKAVNKIFETKRDQTIEFIKQFLAMQRMSTDVVLAPVPLPDDLRMWETTYGINREDHPSMTSKTMSHMKYLSKKLYPADVTRDIKSTGDSGNYKVCLVAITVAVAGEVCFFCSALENKREFKQCLRQHQRQKTMI